MVRKAKTETPEKVDEEKIALEEAVAAFEEKKPEKKTEEDRGEGAGPAYTEQ